MDLRRFVLILIHTVAAAHVAAAPMKSYPLDERSVYTVRLSREEPTTCVSGALKAIVGANASTDRGQPGCCFTRRHGVFSLRAWETPRARSTYSSRTSLCAALPPPPKPTAPSCSGRTTGGTFRKLTPELLRALIERARQQDRPSAHFSGMQVFTDRAQPGTVTAYRNFTTAIESITRFEAEDALVFRVRLENTLPLAVPYDSHGLAIRLDREFFPAAFAEASGAIPARGISYAYLVIAGGPAGLANLSVREFFSVIAPPMKFDRDFHLGTGQIMLVGAVPRAAFAVRWQNQQTSAGPAGGKTRAVAGVAEDTHPGRRVVRQAALHRRLRLAASATDRPP